MRTLKKKEYNRKRKEYIAEKRGHKPKILQERNIKDLRAYRTRNKTKEQELNNKVKVVNTLTDVINARKERKEMEAFRKIKEQKQKKKNKRRKFKRKFGALSNDVIQSERLGRPPRRPINLSKQQNRFCFLYHIC
jgi:hypothetical protein